MTIAGLAVLLLTFLQCNARQVIPAFPAMGISAVSIHTAVSARNAFSSYKLLFCQYDPVYLEHLGAVNRSEKPFLAVALDIFCCLWVKSLALLFINIHLVSVGLIIECIALGIAYL